MTDPTKGTRNALPNRQKRQRRHPPRCPICDARATDRHSNLDTHGVVHVFYVCAREHGWEVRWVAMNWPEAAA